MTFRNCYDCDGQDVCLEDAEISLEEMAKGCDLWHQERHENKKERRINISIEKIERKKDEIFLNIGIGFMFIICGIIVLTSFILKIIFRL